jgi:hypothetical protein
VVAVHYRWGDIGASARQFGMRGRYGGGAAGANEMQRYYTSSMGSLLAALHRLLALPGAPLGPDPELRLYSEGSPSDEPFVQFAAAHPNASLRLESAGSRYAPNPSLLADLRAMAAADVLVTSCGSLGALLAVAHHRGVTLLHPCTAQLLPPGAPAAERALPFSEDGTFDAAAFARLWSTRPAPR